MKVNKTQLKEVIRELMVEILAEGLGSSAQLVEARRQQPVRSSAPGRQSVAPIRQQQVRPQQRQQNGAASMLTDDPTLQQIFARAEQSLLNEEARAEESASVLQAAAKTSEVFSNSAKWDQLAFVDGVNDRSTSPTISPQHLAPPKQSAPAPRQQASAQQYVPQQAPQYFQQQYAAPAGISTDDLDDDPYAEFRE